MEFWMLFAAILLNLLILLLVGAANITFTKKLERIADQLAEFAVQLAFIAGRIGLQRSDFRAAKISEPPPEKGETDAIGFDQWDTSEEDAERLAMMEEEGGRRSQDT